MIDQKIKILIADDHAIVREGLKQIVAEEKDMQVTGEAANAFELMELLKSKEWSIVVLDINMPGKSGLEALHEKLSDREYQIMCNIALGKSAEEIAEELSISINTVYSYRNRILEKMSMKSNVELTQYAVQNKLIEI